MMKWNGWSRWRVDESCTQKAMMPFVLLVCRARQSQRMDVRSEKKSHTLQQGEISDRGNAVTHIDSCFPSARTHHDVGRCDCGLHECCSCFNHRLLSGNCDAPHLRVCHMCEDGSLHTEAGRHMNPLVLSPWLKTHLMFITGDLLHLPCLANEMVAHDLLHSSIVSSVAS